MARCYRCMKAFPDGFEICPHCGYNQAESGQDLYYLPPGTVLGNGRYMVGVAVNTGGFGIVYRAWDNVFDKMIAIKEYYPGGKVNRIPGTCQVAVYSQKDMAEYARGKADFLTEARTVAKFGSLPNVVDVYDFFEENNTAYMVMEYMNGILYSQYIRDHGGKLDPQTVVAVTKDVLAALQEVHKARVIHCDIKPNNINIDENAKVKVKLFDFGAAYLDGVERKNDTLTPCYAPPELYNTRGRRGPYTDIYSVGAMMYFALTGVKPEEATDRLQEDHLVPPHDMDPSISVALSNTVMRAMALKEDIRFQSAAQFREALDSERVAGVEEEIRRRKRRRVIQVAATLTVLAVAGIASGLNMLRQRDESTLRPDTLSVWIVADANDTEDSTTAEARFENMTRSFQEEYKIDCDVTAIPWNEYEERLNAAAASGKLPDVFDSTLLDPEYKDCLEPLEETCELMEDRSGYLFLDAYETYFPDKTQMPLCFQMPLVFERQGIQEEGEEAGEAGPLLEVFRSVEELKDQNGQDSFSVNPEDFYLYEGLLGEDCVERYQQLAQETGRDMMKDAYEMFKTGEVLYYLSDTSDYQLLTEEMPAEFRVVFPERRDYEVRFDHLWSVNKDSARNRRKAAQWMIYYMLSDTAQNALGVKSLEGVPLSKTILNEVFLQAYNGDLPQMDQRVAEVTVRGEDWIRENLEYRKQWGNEE